MARIRACVKSIAYHTLGWKTTLSHRFSHTHKIGLITCLWIVNTSLAKVFLDLRSILVHLYANTCMCCIEHTNESMACRMAHNQIYNNKTLQVDTQHNMDSTPAVIHIETVLNPQCCATVAPKLRFPLNCRGLTVYSSQLDSPDLHLIPGIRPLDQAAECCKYTCRE